MTSRTSSSIDNRSTAGFIRRQRELFRRRLWPAALTFVSYLLYHVAGTATVLSNILQDLEASAGGRGFTAAERLSALGEGISGVMGYNSIFSWMLVPFLAAVLAIEGFAWMDNRREVDFYESQPVSRAKRFWDICVSSFLYFLFSYLITMEIGLVIAGAMGGLTRGIVIEAAVQTLRVIALFVCVYGLGVLSAMLTGNIIVAGLAFLVLMFYEFELKMILAGYCSEFLATYDGNKPGILVENIFTPLYHYSVGSTAECIGRLLALAALYFLLAFLCYRLRRNECAGTAVVFGPVRSVVRVATAVMAGLFIGLLLASIQNSTPLAVLWMVLFTLLTACIMQIIYEYDFRALFHRPLEIAAAVIIALLIFAGFLSDIVGYDRWLPAPDQVTDAALVLTDSSINHCTEEGERVSAEIYGEKYMHLTNVEDVIKIANYGQEFTRKSRNFSAREIMDSSDSTDSREVFSFFVLYRMKNGTTAARRFHLPSTVDPAMMNAVVSTPEYREGFFNIYHDEVVREHAEAFLMEFTNGRDGEFDSMTSEDYEAFRRAYIADLDSFSYTFARYNVPVARVGFSCDRPSAADTYNEYEYIYYSYPVYPSFNSTIRFLKDKGMWAEPLDYEPLLRGNSDYESLSPEDRELYDLTDMSVFTGPFNNSSLQPGN